MKNSVTWIALVGILSIVVSIMRATEPFNAQQAVKEVTSGEVRAAPKSIKQLAFTSLTARTPKQANIFSRIFQGAPAYSVIVRARPKYVMVNGVVVVGKSITVEGFGETKQSATSSAYKKASQAQQSYTQALRTAGLMR